jgi:hypothetical protein
MSNVRPMHVGLITKGTVAIFMLVLPLFCGTGICHADGFDSVRCGADVRKALLGTKMTNEKVTVIEERHKDLELKDLGGTEISNRLFLISWRICGDEYALLEEPECRERRAEISQTFKGLAPIYWLVSIKWSRYPGHGDWCA